MKLFCRHSLAQDIRIVPISDNHSEARLFGITCTKCGKHWKHWNRRLENYFYGRDLRSKIEKVIEIIKN